MISVGIVVVTVGAKLVTVITKGKLGVLVESEIVTLIV
jgi:hypothetical protein